ncbi:MAG: tRNA (adenosine(37)-N6)-dimethylallyltransferase MiaA [Bacteroidota bacterium]
MPVQKFLLVVAGPTASGKTSTAIRLAQHFHSVILSADSRQFYREMNIGTAKPTPAELAAVPHYFIDTLHIEEDYSVGAFERDALALLEQLYREHDLVVLAGGSGLYIRALCAGLDDFPEVPKAVRQHFEQLHAQQGLPALQAALQSADPVYYAQVDQQNPSRLIRALSVCEVSGQPYSSFLGRKAADRPFQPIYLTLQHERALLYDRINRRVDQMVAEGLVEEARRLFPYQHLNALQTVGYQELFAHFEGEHSLEEAIELIKRNTRRYAKRQLTWLRKEGHWRWFEPEEVEGMIEYIEHRRQES